MLRLRRTNIPRASPGPGRRPALAFDCGRERGCAETQLQHAHNYIRSGLGLSLICLLLWLPLARAEATERELVPTTLNVGFMRSCFLNVNHGDAQAAFKSLAEAVGRKRGYRVATQTQIFDSLEEIETAVKAGSINLAIVDSWRYLIMNRGDSLQPYFVPSEQGRIGKKYLLLTRQTSGFNALPDLRGKAIIQLELANCNAGKAWFETLLLAGHCGAESSFFGEITTAPKPALAVLPVFFGKKAACLVDEFSFNLMRELNPQVGKELQVIATSEPYVDNVLCLSDTGWSSPQAKTDFIETLADLHHEPAGQQILTLFKVGQLIPFQESQLDTVKKLRATHTVLMKEAKP